MRLPRLFAGRRRSIFLLLAGNGFAQGGLAIASAWLVMRLFDRLGSVEQSVVPLFAALGLAVLASAWLRRQERIHAESLGQHYVRSTRKRLYGRLLDTDPRALKKRRKGALLLKFVGDLSALRRWISLGLARLLVAGVSVSIALATLTWFHWPFALAVSALLFGAAAWIVSRSTDLRAAIADARRCQASLSSNVTEKLSNLATVQAFNQTARERRTMRRQSNRLLEASVTKATKIGTLRGVIDAAAGASVLVVLAVAYLLPPPDLSPGMVAAVISIIGFLTPPLRDLGRVQEYWLAAQVARDNLLAVSRRISRLPQRRGGRPLQVSDGSIRFRGVSFADVLHDINAEAPGGSRIALYGANGSGKSTLLGLAGRLFDPTRGRILIDGQDIARVELESLRRQIAHVGVDLPLIRGSLRKNLCYGAGRVTPDMLQRVLAQCELQDLVARLPGGLRGRIEENGANLSQGERMRVALARALLTTPRILLLDEPDANLDDSAVRALDRVIEAYPGTLLMATHRRSAMDQCSVGWYLRDGRLQVISNAAQLGHQGRAVVPLRRAERRPPTASISRANGDGK